MPGRQIVDRAGFAAVVRPLYGLARFSGTVIGHFVILYGLRVVVFASFEFVPGVVGQAVAVFILHDPYDAGFRRAFERISQYLEIVAPIVDDAVVETDNDVSAETSQRNVVFVRQPVFGIGAGLFRGRGVVVLVHELTGCRREFVYLIETDLAGCIGRPEISAFRTGYPYGQRAGDFGIFVLHRYGHAVRFGAFFGRKDEKRVFGVECVFDTVRQ